MGFLKPAIDWLERQNWGLFDFIRVGVLTLLNILDPIVTAFVSETEAFIKKLGDLDARIFTFIVNTLNELEIGFKKIWGNLVYLAVDVIDRIRVLVGDLYWSIYYAIKHTIPYLVNKVNGLVSDVADLAEKVITDIGELWEDLKPKVKELIDDAIGVVEAGLDGLKALIENVTKNLLELSNNFTTFITTTWQTFTTQTTSILNVLSKTVYDGIAPTINSIWEIISSIPSIVLDLFNQPEKIREEASPAFKTAITTYLNERITGTSPEKIEPPEEWRTTLHHSPQGWLELLLFFLIPAVIENAAAIWRWYQEVESMQEVEEPLEEPKMMSLNDLMAGVEYVYGTLVDLVQGAIERLKIIYPDGREAEIRETEVTEPEIVASTFIHPMNGPWVLFTRHPYAIYVVIHPSVDGYRVVYDPEKGVWKFEGVKAEECRKLLVEAGVKFATGAVA